MVESAGTSKRRGKQGVLTRKLTLNAVEVVAQAGVVQRRRIRRLPSLRPAGARGRTRRLNWLWARFLLLEDEVEDGGDDGLAGSNSRAQWPRLPRRCALVSSRTLK